MGLTLPTLQRQAAPLSLPFFLALRVSCFYFFLESAPFSSLQNGFHCRPLNLSFIIWAYGQVRPVMPHILGLILHDLFWSSSLPLAGLHRVPTLPECNHSYNYSLGKKTFLKFPSQASKVAGAGDLEIIEVVPTWKENEPMIRIQVICMYTGLVA